MKKMFLSFKYSIIILTFVLAFLVIIKPQPVLAVRPDYCKSASTSPTTMNQGDELVISSNSNTSVNGFYYVTYNLDNLYGPSNPKPVCTGTGTNDQCPNGGTPLIFKDININSMRTFGSVKVPYTSLFVIDKNTGQQAKNLQFNAYFSLNGGEWSYPQPACVAYTKMAIPTRPDYCKSAFADRAVLNTDETLTLSSESNTPVNGFFYLTYNLDNLYGPSNPKPVCTGAGAVTTTCPNGGTPFIFTADETGLRQNGSTHITFGRLFITDKSTGQQLKNLQFNAYFSLNGGEWSYPQPACVAYTKIAVTDPTATPVPPTSTPIPPTATPVPGCLKKIRGDADCDDNLTFRDYFYYVAKKAGAVLPATVNVDFNTSGAVDDADRTIIVNSLLGR